MSFKSIIFSKWIAFIFSCLIFYSAQAQLVDVVTNVSGLNRMYIDGNTLYYATANSIYTLDISQTNASPELLINGLSDAVSMLVYNNELYFCDFLEDRVAKIDLLIPNPTIQIIASNVNGANGIALYGNDLYFSASSSSTILKLDLLTPNASPVVFDTPGFVTYLSTNGDDLYASNASDNVISKYDLLSINPTEVEVIQAIGNPVGHKIIFDTIFIADNGFQKIIKSNIINPMNEDLISNIIDPVDVDVFGSDLYIMIKGENRIAKLENVVYSCLDNSDPGTCNTDCYLGNVQIWDTTFCACVIDTNFTIGCTDNAFCEYNPNANCDDGSCLILNGNCGTNVGCLPTLSNDCTITSGIANFTFNSENNTSINNLSGCVGNDFSFLPAAEVYRNKYYNFTISPNSNLIGMYSVIFVDWNNDLDYLDANEFYDLGVHVGNLNDSILIPSFVEDTLFNFAVFSVYDFIGTPIEQNDYCYTTYFSGDFEEYRLNVLGCDPEVEQSCNTNCSIGDIEFFNASSCTCEFLSESINGCTDINFCEFNPYANCDDGSCLTENNSSIDIFNTASPPTSDLIDDGYIQLVILGGSGDYDYLWLPNVSSNNFASNLTYGTYTIFVFDNLSCAAAEVNITFQNTNCTSILNFSTANPSINLVEEADDIISSSEILNSDKTYKAGHYPIIEYVELISGFESGYNNVELINEQCNAND